MAGFNLAVNSTFQPFSFERYLKPYQMYGEEYKAQEEAYAKAATEAELIGNLIDPLDSRDASYYNQYTQYMSDIDAAATALAKSGLTPGGRKNIFNLTQRYADELEPIKQASDARKALAKEQGDLFKSDREIRFEKRAEDMSLSDFMNGKIVNPRSYSGTLLTKQVAESASHLAKEMREDPRKWRSILGGQYYESMMKSGFTSEEILAAVAKKPEARKELTTLIEEAIATSGISDWEGMYDDSGNLTQYGQKVMNEAYDFAGRGLWSAIGDTKYDVKENWMGKLNYQEALRRKAMTPTGGVAPNPLALYDAKEVSAHGKQIQDYSKYITIGKDGKYKFTEEGKKEYARTRKSAVSANGWGTWYDEEPSSFAYFVNDLLGNKIKRASLYEGHEGDILGLDKIDFEKLGGLWEDFTNKYNGEATDATKATEFDYRIADKQQDSMKRAILTASGNLPLQGVEFVGNDLRFTPSGKDMSLKDFSDSKVQILSTRFSPYGDSKGNRGTVLIKDKDGNIGRYILPAGINPTNETSRDNMMARAAAYQEAISQGKYIGRDGTWRTATPEQLAIMEEKYKQALQEAYMYHSQLGVENEVEPQKFGVYSF